MIIHINNTMQINTSMKFKETCMEKGQKSNLVDVITPKDRVFVFYDLEHIAEGTIVERWPLHCTIIAPFYPEGELAIDSLGACIRDELSQFRQISAAPDQRTHFGQTGDVPVQTLKSSAETRRGDRVEEQALRLLHTRIIFGLLGICGSTLTDHSWLHSGYNAHVSCPEDMNIEPFDINELSIGVARDGVGKVVASVVAREATS